MDIKLSIKKTGGAENAWFLYGDHDSNSLVCLKLGLVISFYFSRVAGLLKSTPSNILLTILRRAPMIYACPWRRRHDLGKRMISALWAEPACQSASSPYLGPYIMTVFKIKVSNSPTEYQLPAIERCPS